MKTQYIKMYRIDTKTELREYIEMFPKRTTTSTIGI